MRAPASITVHRRLEWSEADPMGRWHYGCVLRFVEVAETALHHRLGIEQETFPRMPRASLSVEFLAPLHYAEVGAVTLAVEHVGRSSLRYGFTVRRGADVLARGAMTVVWVDPDTGRGTPWPDRLRALLSGAGQLEPAAVGRT